MTSPGQRQYSQKEEMLHALSHGVGMILSIAGLIWMLEISFGAADPWRIVASGVYGLSLIALLLSSTVYHALHSSPRSAQYKLIDHCAIYVLIAGTSTPFLLVAMQTDLRWWLLAAIWSMAVVGILAKIWLRHQYPKLSLISYLLMGWLMVLAVPQLSDSIAVNGIVWLIAGGVSYTVGAIFYAAKQLHYNHVIWHLFVLAGAACHFLAVVWYVLPVSG